MAGGNLIFVEAPVQLGAKLSEWHLVHILETNSTQWINFYFPSKEVFMYRVTILACSVFLLLGSTVFADDDVSFLNFTLIDPLPESVIGGPVDDTEVELERIDGGVVIEGETSGLLPDHVYTIWALVFNNPAGCNDGCQIADDIGPDSGFAALWTGIGFVADEDGEAEFEVVIMEGEPAGEVLMGAGLTDAGNAEIHLII